MSPFSHRARIGHDILRNVRNNLSVETTVWILKLIRKTVEFTVTVIPRSRMVKYWNIPSSGIRIGSTNMVP